MFQVNTSIEYNDVALLKNPKTFSFVILSIKDLTEYSNLEQPKFKKFEIEYNYISNEENLTINIKYSMDNYKKKLNKGKYYEYIHNDIRLELSKIHKIEIGNIIKLIFGSKGTFVNNCNLDSMELE